MDLDRRLTELARISDAPAPVVSGTLQSGAQPACRLCGHATAPVDLGAAMVARVVAAGGSVETVDIHQPLARAAGVVAVLRYPL